MKQVIVVGDFTQRFRELCKAFTSMYDVRTCVNKLEVFDTMYKMKQPDAVMYLIEEKEDCDEELLEALKKGYMEVPVVCLNADVDDEWIKKYMKSHRFVYVPSDSNLEDIVGMMEHVIKRKESGEYELGVVNDEEPEAIQRADMGFAKSPCERASSKKNLLLVDDSGFALRTIRGFIGDKYDVRMVTSGLDAIAAIHQKKPDLILLDYQMPMYDGKQTMEKIKEVEGAQDIPIVFVTSVNSKEHIKAVLDLKPAGYLLKPVDGDRLMQTIENILGK